MARLMKITAFWLILVVVLLVISSCGGSSVNDTKKELEPKEAEKSVGGGDRYYGEDLGRYVTFHLYTKLNPHKSQLLHINDSKSIRKSNFNPLHPTRLLAPGCFTNWSAPFAEVVRDAYLDTDEYNVIVVDYYSIETLPYAWAVIKVQIVGAYVAQFIDFLVESGNLENLDSLELIGANLGGHMVGFVGRNVQSGRIRVIHALDPLGQYFDYGNETTRLARSDAKYVQVILSDAYSHGFAYPIGHVTFYPAYGKRQPACGINAFCSDAMSFYYFAEAIRKPKSFLGRQCSDVTNILLKDKCDATGVQAYMADRILSKRYYGVYYVPVRSTSPYGYGGKDYSNDEEIEL